MIIGRILQETAWNTVLASLGERLYESETVDTRLREDGQTFGDRCKWAPACWRRGKEGVQGPGVLEWS